MPDLPLAVRRAFFGRFGGVLRPIQQAAVDLLEPARDGLIIAGTGSGKTEAALAPVASSLMNLGPARGARPLALVLSPTRALATDLFKRVRPPFEALRLRVDVATSDRNTLRPEQGCDVLIRTPEGLDATLCRHADLISSVCEVVIDEVHSYLDSARGTQLAGLLWRMTRARPLHRRIGISATLPDPCSVEQARLLRNPIVVQSEAVNRIEVLIHHWVGSTDLGVGPFLRWLRECGARKCIAFARSKARVEEAAKLLNQGWLSGNCHAHHAGLSTSERRRVEERVRHMRAGMVVATTTLELGIDIGDIDTCVLLDPPPDAMSLLQRAGRAGRRSGTQRVVIVDGLFARGSDFAPVLATMRAPTPRRDTRPFLTGVLQQTVSLVAGDGCVPPDHLITFLVDAFGLPEEASSRVLRCLLDRGFLGMERESVTLARASVDLLASLALHRTFGTAPGTNVRDSQTGRVVGRALVSPGDSVLLAGRAREATGISLDGRSVRTREVDSGVASFGSNVASPFEALASVCQGLVGPSVRL